MQEPCSWLLLLAHDGAAALLEGGHRHTTPALPLHSRLQAVGKEAKDTEPVAATLQLRPPGGSSGRELPPGGREECGEWLCLLLEGGAVLPAARFRRLRVIDGTDWQRVQMGWSITISDHHPPTHPTTRRLAPCSLQLGLAPHSLPETTHPCTLPQVEDIKDLCARGGLLHSVPELRTVVLGAASSVWRLTLSCGDTLDAAVISPPLSMLLPEPAVWSGPCCAAAKGSVLVAA